MLEWPVNCSTVSLRCSNHLKLIGGCQPLKSTGQRAFIANFNYSNCNFLLQRTTAMSSLFVSASCTCTRCGQHARASASAEISCFILPPPMKCCIVLTENNVRLLSIAYECKCVVSICCLTRVHKRLLLLCHIFVPFLSVTLLVGASSRYLRGAI